MKKLTILALAIVLVAAFTVPASALENKFGGYWRTRFFSQGHFTGDEDDRDRETQQVDTRTRLYYTAVLNDNLQFINKFEYDAVWGGDDTYGEVAADKKEIEIKNSYAQWQMGDVELRMGVQGLLQSRGFVLDDDAAGIVALWKMSDMFNLGAFWVRGWEGGTDNDDEDFELVGLVPTVSFGNGMVLKPFLLWYYSSDFSEDFSADDDVNHEFADIDADEVSVYMVGADFDASFDAFSMWLTAIYQGGTVDEVDSAGGEDVDVSAYLLAAGGSFNFGMADVHGQVFYASGDDDPDDDDFEAFAPVFGQSYYWAEIMGYGIFDNQASEGAPFDKITNIMAANLGVGVKPMDKLKLTLDVWYAQLAEDDINGEDYLGTEVDLKVTYQLVEGLNLDLVGAYLFAGDATSTDGSNEDDPYEIGARFSLSF
ncbi:MAG: alginate export family protein [Desulfobacterales bacterium]